MALAISDANVMASARLCGFNFQLPEINGRRVAMSSTVRANSCRLVVVVGNTPNESTTVNVHITIAEAIIQDDAVEAADIFMAAKLFLYQSTPNGSGLRQPPMTTTKMIGGKIAKSDLRNQITDQRD
jgi:hypothetical protein